MFSFFQGHGQDEHSSDESFDEGGAGEEGEEEVEEDVHEEGEEDVDEEEVNEEEGVAHTQWPHAQEDHAQWRHAQEDVDEEVEVSEEEEEEENVAHTQWPHAQEDHAQWRHAQEDVDEESAEERGVPFQSFLGRDRGPALSFPPNPSVGEQSPQLSSSDPPSPDIGRSFPDAEPSHVPWAPPSSGFAFPSARSLNVHEQISQHSSSITSGGPVPPSSEMHHSRGIPQGAAPPFYHQPRDAPSLYHHSPSFSPGQDAGHVYEHQGYPIPTSVREVPGRAQSPYYNTTTPPVARPLPTPERSYLAPNLTMPSPAVYVAHGEHFGGGGNDAYGGHMTMGYRPPALGPYDSGADQINMTFDTTASLLSNVLEAPVLSHSSSEVPGVPRGLPFLGLETGFDTPRYSKVDQKTVSVQSQSIEYGLRGLREQDLLTSREANASRIRPILQLGQTLNREASDLEARMRNGDRLNSEFINQVRKILNELRELLELIHLPNTRIDSSHRPLLDMSLSVLAMLARSLFSLSESQNSREYFRLSKRSLMIATSYLPKAHPARPIIASHWGTLYLERFQFFGNKSHIAQAIKFHRQSIEAMPINYPKRAMFLGWLGRSYLARFEDSQSAEDLKNGIEFSSQAWKEIRSKAGNATLEEKKYIFEGASRGLQCLIEHVGGSNSISLINTGIREWRSTLYDLLKHGETGGDLKAGCMRILGFLYITRFNQLGSRHPRDLERSLTFLASAVALLPERHQDFLSTLCVFAHSLAARAGARASSDSELAFGFLELAQRLTQSVPSFEPHLLASFGDFYMSLSRQGTDSAHLTKAIEYHSRALKHPACRPGSRLWAKVRQKLGLCRLYEYKKARKPAEATEKLELALRQFIHITLSPRGHLFDRFTAACSWATNAASHPLFRTQALYGYETAMELIPLLACFGAVPDQRRKATQKSGQLATAAAATAIKVGNNALALTLLEQGRSVKWNHMLQLQSPLHTLKLSPGGEPLANRLEEILKSLQLGGSTSSTQLTKQSSHGDLDLQDRYQQVLDDIRKMKGFANFMRPKPIEDLVKAARNGPAVVINIHKSRCDALVVHPLKGKAGTPGIQHIPLPELSPDRVIKMRDSIDQSLEKIGSARGNLKEKQQLQGTKQLEAELKYLWYWVVEPILKGLGYKPRSARDPDPNKLPRITWCATGPLSFLPLHAAGDYDDPRKKTFEYVVSSYTPTLSALVPDSHHDVLPKSSCDILMVNPETGSGEDALPAAEVELKCITRHFRIATGSLGRRLGDNIENLSWIWESASNSSNSSQAHLSPQFSLDMDGVSDDESDQGSRTRLPQNQGEASRYTRLDGPKASPEKVYEEMQKHDWVHFACHAVQNNGDPAKCGFYMGGKLLSLQKIARMRYEKRGLAFLSACRTAKGDQNLPDEAVHLASGMLMTGYSSVIATLWPVKDNDAPFVANIVYKRLLVDEGMKCNKSAVALHTALDRLRKEPGVRLPDWISFVHFGA